MPISSALGSSALLPAGLGFRNVLINGEFRINQRGYTSASNLASGSYGFDRWKSTFTNTTLTFTSAPQGQIVTINSGGSVEQVIERENVSAGTYVLSWTGTATGRVYNTGATPPSYAASPIVVTLDGLANVEVEFTASGGTRTLWKPQLEQNFQPTPFEQRPIGVELALCQRYFQTISSETISSYNPYWNVALSGGDQRSPLQFKTTMRTIPTILTTGGSSVHSFQYRSYNTGVVNYNLDGSIAGTVDAHGIKGLPYYSTNNGGGNLAVGYAVGTNNNIIWVSAEL
jgi:hypothetical protein